MTHYMNPLVQKPDDYGKFLNKPRKNFPIDINFSAPLPPHPVLCLLMSETCWKKKVTKEHTPKQQAILRLNS